MNSNLELSKRIVAYGYFSNEIPKEFTSEQLGCSLDLIDTSDSRLSKKLKNKWSKAIEFSIPRIENFRRTLTIPTPLQYVLLSKLLEDKWSELQIHFDKSTVSLTTPIESDEVGESIKPKHTMDEKIYQRIDNLSNNKYILQTDITRYYPSIYTHSLPWALHTKKTSKANMTDPSYFGNEIDKLVRNMQDGQTIGIPIGPITSLILQEIIGTAIDSEFSIEMNMNINGYRYIDDMEYYFNSIEEAERGLNILNKVVKRYQLELNTSKTKIMKTPIKLEPEWIYFFRTFKFRKSNIKKISLIMQKSDLTSYFSKAFEFAENSNEKGILAYALKTVRKNVILQENWSTFESLILHTALVDPLTIPIAFEIIEGYKYRGYPIDIDKITRFVNGLIQSNIELKNDFEVTWVLSVANRLNIQINEEVSKHLLKSDNAIINTLTMILYDKDLLDGELNFDHYRALLTHENLYSSHWLFVYECCNQKWLGQNKNKDYIKTDKFYKQLLDNKISFINPNFSLIVTALSKLVLEKMDIELFIKSGGATAEKIKENVLQVLEKSHKGLDEDIVEDVLVEVSKKINKMLEETQEEIKQETQEEIKQETQEEIKQETQEEIKQETQEEIKQETQEEIKQETQEEIKQETQEEIKQETQEEIKQETQEEIKQETQEEIKQETQEEIKQETQEEIKQETQEEIKQETQEEIKQETQEEIKQETQEEIKQETQEEIKQETQEEIKQETQEEIKQETQEEIKQETQEEIKQETQEEIKQETQEEIKQETQEEIKQETQEEIKQETQEEIKQETQEEIKQETQEERNKENKFNNDNWLLNFFNTDISKKHTIHSNYINNGY
ncbi:reverse transcriptase domain-containing protein [Anaeromicrobium sediminis]|uniref:reverse transcriptase domain-containing protein n=1 Tax=Anaeromicrobium sediminis TaxID=1478221 RepID=UPI0011403965|nr:reverse transcriptase domain-containing protein [Anaeromicrobium sediminis]